jgi:hypothetical protein
MRWNILNEMRIGAKELNKPSPNIRLGFEAEFIFKADDIAEQISINVPIYSLKSVDEIAKKLQLNEHMVQNIYNQYFKGDWNSFITNIDVFDQLVVLVNERHFIWEQDSDTGIIHYFPKHGSLEIITQSYQTISNELKTKTSFDVDIFQKYHQAQKTPSNYTLEPDSSLQANETRNEVGIEIVSPIFTDVEKMIENIRIVFNIIEQYGITTKRCSFHISASNITTLQPNNLKIALLIGDRWINTLWGREYNDYTKDMQTELSQWIKIHPKENEDWFSYINKAETDLAKLPHLSVDITNAQIQNGRVEFRMIGGKSYHKYFNDVVKLTRRFIYSLNVLNDPSFDNNNYLKKFSTIYQNVQQSLGVFDVYLFNKFGLSNFAIQMNKNYNSLDNQSRRRYKRIAESIKTLDMDWNSLETKIYEIRNDPSEYGIYFIESIHAFFFSILNNITIYDLSSIAKNELRNFAKILNITPFDMRKKQINNKIIEIF